MTHYYLTKPRVTKLHVIWTYMAEKRDLSLKALILAINDRNKNKGETRKVDYS